MPQPVQNAYKSLEDFTSQIKSLTLTKIWKVEVKKQLVAVSLISSDYMLPVYEIFIDNLLNFTVRVHSYVLPDNHELIHDTPFNNVTLSKCIERLIFLQIMKWYHFTRYKERDHSDETCFPQSIYIF